ncbi:MAG: putative Fe2+ transport system protein, subunit A (modular protein) [Promethearchaeota archaeon]|nr:MAG: putative Fe2+ transport system protein, subunit A (modular protein) [Candidatus Lokiarchaeota archaeon]
MIESILKNIQGKDQRGSSLIKCLTECEKDEIISVIKVDTGKKAKQRLSNLGIVPGAKLVKCRSAPLKGPLEVKIKGSSLVLGRGIASKIFVKCSEEQCQYI